MKIYILLLSIFLITPLSAQKYYSELYPYFLQSVYIDSNNVIRFIPIDLHQNPILKSESKSELIDSIKYEFRDSLRAKIEFLYDSNGKLLAEKYYGAFDQDTFIRIWNYPNEFQKTIAWQNETPAKITLPAKTTLQYNNQNLPVLRLEQRWDNNQKLVHQNKILYYFDSEVNLDSILYFNWNKQQDSAWIIIHRCRVFYNDKNELISWLHEYKSRSGFENETLFSFYYDENSSLKSIVVQIYRDDKWNNHERMNFTANEDELSVHGIYENWVENNWEVWQEFTYHFNKKGDKQKAFWKPLKEGFQFVGYITVREWSVSTRAYVYYRSMRNYNK